MTRLIGIKVQVLPDTERDALMVIEKLSNVVTGLALEGIAAEISVTPYEHEPEDES